VLSQALAIKGAKVSLGVADVYRKEHGAIMAGSEPTRRAVSPRSA
jgi:hypothetical protein